MHVINLDIVLYIIWVFLNGLFYLPVLLIINMSLQSFYKISCCLVVNETFQILNSKLVLFHLAK